MTPSLQRRAPDRAGKGHVRALLGRGRSMFFFFSNRLGCLPSLLLSIGVTVVLLLLLGVL